MATCPDERYRNEELALTAAQKALELDGDKDPRYIETLAAAYANAGQYDSAVAILQGHLDKMPQQYLTGCSPGSNSIERKTVQCRPSAPAGRPTAADAQSKHAGTADPRSAALRPAAAASRAIFRNRDRCVHFGQRDHPWQPLTITYGCGKLEQSSIGNHRGGMRSR